MSISKLSFWQQNQNYQVQQFVWDQQQAGVANLTSVLTSALSNKMTGLASIANAQALKRVTKQITKVLQSTLDPADQSSSSAKPSPAPAKASTAKPKGSAIAANAATNLQNSSTAASLMAGSLATPTSGHLFDILA